MDDAPAEVLPADWKGFSSRGDLPSPVLAVPKHSRLSPLRRTLACIVILLTALFIGSRYGWRLPFRQENRVEWRRPIHFGFHHLVPPTDESCLAEWNTNSSDSPLIATPLGERRFHATSRFTFRREVQTYFIDSEIWWDPPSVQVHVVPGFQEHTTVSVDAFYDNPAILDTFYACTYRADETEELLSEQRMFVDVNGTTTTEALDFDPVNLRKSDVLRLHRRENTKESERGVGVNAWLNITFSIPSKDRQYSLHSDGFDVNLYAGLTLNDVRLTGGRIVVQEGVVARDIDIYATSHEKHDGTHNGIFGHLSSSGNVSLSTTRAPIDAHLEITHSLVHQEQTVFLHSYGSSVQTTLLLLDSSKMAGQNRFKVNAVSWDGPLDLTIRDGSSYAAVSIDAEANNAPARLSLDSTFEGTFLAKSIDPGMAEGVSVSYTHAEPHSGYERMFQKPFKTRHIHAGAVGWGSEEAASSASSFAEVRSIGRSAHIDI